MGQAKSKTWRRLSESDCVHLLNDDELNNHNNIYPQSGFQNQDFKCPTITNAKKWPPPNSNKCNNLTDDNVTRNRSGSACVTPSSDATLIKFSKFDNGEFVPKSTNYNKNLYEASKNGSLVRKSLPSCPTKILAPVSGVGLRHPLSARFYPAILEPELLLRQGKSSNIDPEDGDAFHQSNLIESPPPILDSNPFKQSNMRPITLYQFEPFASKQGTTFNHCSSMSRGLSLSDMLEQCNTFEEEEFSDQTLVDTGGTLPPIDTDEHTEAEKDVNNNSNNCILVDITSPSGESEQLGEQVPRMSPPKTGIRCSSFDCTCDRCLQHRFKLLNWLLPNCTRINAERLLHGRREGTFLVRKSEKFPGQVTIMGVMEIRDGDINVVRSARGQMSVPIRKVFTLSVTINRQVRHCLILRSVYGFGLRWPYSFETLAQVILHYGRTTLAEFNSKLDVRLRYPVFMT